MRTDIDDSRNRGIGKNRIDIKITGTARFSSIAGNKASNCQLLKIVLSAMVTIKPISQKGGFSLVIGVCPLMSRLEVDHQYMIGWGAGSVYMNGLVSVLAIFQGIKKSSRK